MSHELNCNIFPVALQGFSDKGFCPTGQYYDYNMAPYKALSSSTSTTRKRDVSNNI